MSLDPIEMLPIAFGRVLTRRRDEARRTVLDLAHSLGLRENEVLEMQRGQREPTLREFFSIARAFGEQAPMLLIDVMMAWWEGGEAPHVTRPSDFVRLMRLGYRHRPRDFRELSGCYYSIPEAMRAAETLNAQRLSRGVALLDTVTVYVRLDYLSLRADETGGRER
jgi:transcriptional regulator with XRE-family HTH domain